MAWQDYDREVLLRVIDAIPGVINWRAASGVVFLITDESVEATAVAEVVRRLIPDLRFIVTPIQGLQCDGAADPETWAFINTPRPPSRTATLPPLPSPD